MVASEAAPFAKTGGLGDVMGSLPGALKARGEEVAVVLPRYTSVPLADAEPVEQGVELWVGPARHWVDLYKIEHRGVPYYFVDLPWMFDRGGLYGYGDDHIRFATLCHATLHVARHLFPPNLIHGHDWQAALLPLYIRNYFPDDPVLGEVKLLFTIHNLGYQGIYPKDHLWGLGIPEWLYREDLIEFHGRMNIMKAGLVYSDHLSTVSKAYAREIQTPEYGFGLDGLLRSRSHELTGILNGVDYHDWNPETDRYLNVHYSADDLDGKAECKRQLLQEFGMTADRPEVPVIGVVSRLVTQKGFDLVAAIANELQHYDVRMVVLGSGEHRYEELFRYLAHARPDKFGARIAYDNRVAHLIEAGADMFLMPSHYEPCGLNQIYSLRYGTVPVVRATGGLDDTIDSSTGFKFHDYHPGALLWAIREALAAYWDRERWQTLQRNGMRRDYSWDASAAEYSGLYQRLLS